MLEDPQPKLCSVCAKFAQKRGRRFVLCLYSHNYFEQEIKNAVFFTQFTYISRSHICTCAYLTTLTRLPSTANPESLSDQMRPIQLKFNCSAIDTVWDKLISFQPIRGESLLYEFKLFTQTVSSCFDARVSLLLRQVI